MVWNPVDYARNAAFVPVLGEPVLDLLDPEEGDTILDLGCGDGVLSQRIAERGARVLGLDSSAAMLEAARARGINVIQGDGQRLDFNEQFDGVFSNAALHWMDDHQAVAEGVFRALKPGGRYVGECGGFGNIAAIRTALRAVLLAHGCSPDQGGGQNYPTADVFREIHQRAGFINVELWVIPRPTPLPAGMRGWLRTFRSGFLDAAGAGEDKREQVISEVEALLKPALCDGQGHWIADYVRLRWQADKPI